jgi:Adenylate and Guanylate cyclase catalytic domain
MANLHSFAANSRYTGFPVDDEMCRYTFQVYPSDKMKVGKTSQNIDMSYSLVPLINTHFLTKYVSKLAKQTNQGIIFAISAVAFIVFPFMVFLIYEQQVSRQQQLLVSSAQRSNAIVASLFPSNVRDKLYPQSQNNKSDENNCSAPIADLHVETTVVFADIVNFTMWSSVRDPYDVFTLLETIYAAFDEVANRRNVFKVETIGDCYVAGK